MESLELFQRAVGESLLGFVVSELRLRTLLNGVYIGDEFERVCGLGTVLILDNRAANNSV